MSEEGIICQDTPPHAEHMVRGDADPHLSRKIEMIEVQTIAKSGSSSVHSETSEGNQKYPALLDSRTSSVVTIVDYEVKESSEIKGAPATIAEGAMASETRKDNVNLLINQLTCVTTNDSIGTKVDIDNETSDLSESCTPLSNHSRTNSLQQQLSRKNVVSSVLVNSAWKSFAERTNSMNNAKAANVIFAQSGEVFGIHNKSADVDISSRVVSGSIMNERPKNKIPSYEMNMNLRNITSYNAARNSFSKNKNKPDYAIDNHKAISQKTSEISNSREIDVEISRNTEKELWQISQKSLEYLNNFQINQTQYLQNELKSMNRAFATIPPLFIPENKTWVFQSQGSQRINHWDPRSSANFNEWMHGQSKREDLGENVPTPRYCLSRAGDSEDHQEKEHIKKNKRGCCC